MNKLWSILFGVSMAAAFLLFPYAYVKGWWLPQDVSTYGDRIDWLFYLILFITGFFFVVTEALMVYFMYVYAGKPEGQQHVFGHHYAEERVMWTSFFKRIFKPVTALIHDQHRLELAWSLIPGLILLFIAIAQINVWAEIKYQTNMPALDTTVQQMEVTARQWEWRVRYPSPRRLQEWKTNPELAKRFLMHPEPDDVRVVNEIHVWKGSKADPRKVLVHLKTLDVLHSFFLPHVRVKQDALPGKTIPVWFAVTEANTVRREEDGQVRWVEKGYDPKTGKTTEPGMIWELACAEFCGSRHSMMRGKLYVHETEQDFLAWLELAAAEGQRTQPPAAR